MGEYCVGEAAYKEARAMEQKAQMERDEEMVREMQREIEEAERAEVQKRAQFTCPLCFDEAHFDDGIALDCDHRLCVECFKNYLTSRISEAQVADDELICPIPKCETQITVTQIEGATKGDSLWDKFLQFRMNLWRPPTAEGSIIECANNSCECRFVASKTLKKVECPMCKTAFCPGCGEEPHEENTCEEYAEWKN